MFHVPAWARITDHPQLWSTPADGNNGAFALDSCEPGWQLFLVCSDGSESPNEPTYQWEHVSVQARRGNQSRIPTWKEMAYVKGLCWDDEDVAVQFHPRRSEYVNQHPHVLHLWRPTFCDLPTPPPILVGVL
jgi:hypothetical protein